MTTINTGPNRSSWRDFLTNMILRSVGLHAEDRNLRARKELLNDAWASKSESHRLLYDGESSAEVDQ